jgi:gamma-glutamyltranspeptidase
MPVKNPTAAITRALKEAAKLNVADLSRVIEDISAAPEPSEALLSAAYVEGIYGELAGEDRRYLTSKLKSLLATKQPAPAPEGTTQP